MRRPTLLARSPCSAARRRRRRCWWRIGQSAIVDRFGKDVESAPVDATHARVHVTVAASPVFFGWLAQFGTAVRLEAPSALARQYADYLRDIADSYYDPDGKSHLP